MYDKILAIIQEQGPMIPIEIAGKTNTNSFLAKAYMEELVTQGKLKQGTQVGSTNIFFLSGQEELATKRAEDLNKVERTVASHVGKDLDQSPEAQAKRENFKKHFEKSLSEPEPEKPVFIEKQKPIIQEPVERIKPYELQQRIDKVFGYKPEMPKPVEKRFTPPKLVERPKVVFVEKKPEISGYVDKVSKMFTNQTKLIETIEQKKKKGLYIVDFPSSVGDMRFYVEVHDKKSITKSDVALAYAEAANRKLSALIISNGKLASTAEQYAGGLGSWFKFKQVK